MRTNLLVAIRELFKRRGFSAALFGVLLGLLLARFIQITPFAAMIVLCSGITFVLVVLLRKADLLIFGWFFLTSFFYLIIYRFFPYVLPPEYYRLLGTVMFWGLLVCVMAAWAIDNTVCGRSFRPLSELPLSLILVLALFVLWSGLTMISSVDVYHSAKQWSHILIGLGLSYMFYDFFSRDESNLRRMFTLISLLVMVMSLAVIAIALQGLASGSEIYKAISLWFWNPNVVGDFLFSFTPILITSGFYFKPLKGMRFVFLALVLLALFFSSARTSWLAGLCSIAFLFWMSGRHKWALVAGSVALLVLAGMTVPLWRQPLYDFVAGPRYTGRQELWRAAWNVACDYPVLGTGLGNCQEFMNEYIEVAWLRNQNTHNAYLRNAADMGFFSGAITLAFYAIFFHSSWAIERALRSNYLRLAVRGTMATYVGMFVHDMFQNGSMLTYFNAAEAHIMFPYILLALPFAAKILDERQGNYGAEPASHRVRS